MKSFLRTLFVVFFLAKEISPDRVEEAAFDNPDLLQYIINRSSPSTTAKFGALSATTRGMVENLPKYKSYMTSRAVQHAERTETGLYEAIAEKDNTRVFALANYPENKAPLAFHLFELARQNGLNERCLRALHNRLNSVDKCVSGVFLSYKSNTKAYEAMKQLNQAYGGRSVMLGLPSKHQSLPSKTEIIETFPLILTNNEQNVLKCAVKVARKRSVTFSLETFFRNAIKTNTFAAVAEEYPREYAEFISYAKLSSKEISADRSILHAETSKP
jgi:hypothetical protein